MATYTLKRFSTNTSNKKVYRIKRKSFTIVGEVMNPVADVTKNALDTGVGVAKNVGGTALEATGGVVKTAGKVAKPFAGLGGAAAGYAATTAALGPANFIPVVGSALRLGGALVGSKLGKGAVEATKNIGDSIQQGGTDLKYS